MLFENSVPRLKLVMDVVEVERADDITNSHFDSVEDNFINQANAINNRDGIPECFYQLTRK